MDCKSWQKNEFHKHSRVEWNTYFLFRLCVFHWAVWEWLYFAHKPLALQRRNASYCCSRSCDPVLALSHTLDCISFGPTKVSANQLSKREQIAAELRQSRKQTYIHTFFLKWDARLASSHSQSQLSRANTDAWFQEQQLPLRRSNFHISQVSSSWQSLHLQTPFADALLFSLFETNTRRQGGAYRTRDLGPRMPVAEVAQNDISDLWVHYLVAKAYRSLQFTLSPRLTFPQSESQSESLSFFLFLLSLFFFKSLFYSSLACLPFRPFSRVHSTYPWTEGSRVTSLFCLAESLNAASISPNAGGHSSTG